LSGSLLNNSNRRGFLKQIGLLGAASMWFRISSRAWASDSTATGTKIGDVFKNRTPLAPSAFYPLPLGSIRPTGWLLSQLKIQASGLSGRLDETWPDVGPNSGWLGGTGEAWERGPYFLDGLVPLAYLLNDAKLKAKVQKFVDWTLNNQAADGMIGPRANDDWWPRMVMLKALTQYQEATGDPRVIPVMQKYCEYQLSQLPSRKLKDWGKFRWQDEALSVVWLYNRTGNPKLLDLLKLLREQGYDWVSSFTDFRFKDKTTLAKLKELETDLRGDISLATHGVNNGQAIKVGPISYLFTANEDDRKAVLWQIAELNKYHGLPNGMFSCDEHLAGRNPSQGSEFCTVVEYMFSLEQSLAILGDPRLGDRLELLAFNALPGTTTDDMWAHQYDQQPNQVECSLHKEPWSTNGPDSNLFGLEPNFGCCTANYHQGWPKFAASLFMVSPDDGLVATAYSPCEVHTKIRNVPIHVTEETNYPFRGSIRLTINPSGTVEFPLFCRIPEWATGATVQLNGEQQAAIAAGSFVRIYKKWKANDQVEINFPLIPRVIRGFNDSVSVERGPLVFSYPIGAAWVKLRDRGLTADWQVYPTTEWNYALAVDPNVKSHDISTTESEIGSRPFAPDQVPIKLHLKAKKIPDWRAEEGVAMPVPQSPVSTSEPEEKITLIPYAAAKLRITAFPYL
jgi:uncharacterized protein